MNDYSSIALDPLCKHCGRPVIGPAVWGVQGPYHPQCASSPWCEKGTEHLKNPELEAMIERIIERKLDEYRNVVR